MSAPAVSRPARRHGTLTHPARTGLLLVAPAVAFVVVVVLGTLVLFTYDPCPTDAPADLLASFCSAN